MTHGLACDGDVSVFFKGTLENNPADCEDAEYIMAEYKAAFDRPGMAAAGGGTPEMGVLAQLRGPWAFIIHDRSHGRILAARDPAGAESLYWGTTMLSEGVLFASDRALIDSECADADAFPPGAVFVSEDFSTSGSLSNISTVDAEADEAQQQAEALCRVESSGQMERSASVSEIQAN